MTSMFTKDEAVTFLESSWGMKQVLERLQRDKERGALLDEIVTLVQAKVPFQGITFMAVPLAERKRPSWETIKRECMAGIGGVCYSLNVFAWGLLKAVGFSAHLCHATCTSSVTSDNNHVIVLVSDLQKKGDLFLVECGFGFPTFRAISLDFEEESLIFVDSFLEYKFIRHDGYILRMHGKGDRIKRRNPPDEKLDFIVGKWRRFYYFKPIPSDQLEDFDVYFDRVFTLPRQTPFDTSPRALCFPEHRAVSIVDNKIMLENDGGELISTELASDDEIISAYKLYFPALAEDIVRKSLTEWHNITKNEMQKL